MTQKESLKVKVRLYDRLFNISAPDQDKDKDFKSFLNPHSLETIDAYVEPGLANTNPGDQFQFQRLGYFVLDKDTKENHLIFNKTVGLRDNWSK